MLGIGTPEVLLVLLLALILLGPKKLPEVARRVGKGIADLRRMMYDLTSDDGKDGKE